MADEIIACPKCGTKIQLTEALTEAIRDRLRADVETEAAEKRAELNTKHEAVATKEKQLAEREKAMEEAVEQRLREERDALTKAALVRAEKDYGAKAKSLEEELKEKREKLAQAELKELDLLRQQRELNEAKEALALEMARKLSEERELLRTEGAKAAEEANAQKTLELENELNEKRLKLKEAQEKELALLRQQKILEDREQALQLEVERTLAVERKKIQEDAVSKVQEDNARKMRVKDDLIEAMKRQVAEVQRRAEVGSQEAQGEALEGQLSGLLSGAFLFDTFEDVKKGARGADIVHKVRNSAGMICGTILWESKNTKQFQKTWIAKLKQDQQDARADVAVLMSTALPEGIKDFAYLEDEGVWVTNYASVLGVCAALRQILIQVNRERIVAKHRDTLKDLVYDYVTGQEFARRVKAVADSYTQMQSDLEAEKLSMIRIWKKREKQISVVLNSVAEIHGELAGLVGTAGTLPTIAPLFLENIAPEDEGEEMGV
jgi:hypothetical protein